MFVYTTLQLYLKGFSVTLSGRGILRVHGVRVLAVLRECKTAVYGGLELVHKEKSLQVACKSDLIRNTCSHCKKF